MKKKSYEWRYDLLEAILQYDNYKTLSDCETAFFNTHIPKNIYNVEKPSLPDAKEKHMSRFSNKKL